MHKRNLFLVLFLTLCTLGSNAQIRNPFKKKKKEVKTEQAAQAPKPAPAPNGQKPYGEVITKEAQTNAGFFKTHKVKDRFYFEIPDSIMGRDILVVSRIAKAPVNKLKSTIGYAGDQIGENVIQFEKGPNNKIFMRSISYMEQAKDTLGMYLSVKNSNIQPIVASFNVQTSQKDTANNSQSTVIDITDFLNGDNDIFFFNTNLRKNKGIGGYAGDRSYVDTIKAYPINIEIKTVKTYTQVPPQGYSPQMMPYFSNDPITFELNSSLVLLPKEPMKPRLFDPRVAYFAVRYTDFDSNPIGIDYKSKITRWRLEPKDEDLEKYKNGELVEPKKPIVFYIDPTTPKKWVPYLIAGVNDWQKAFEKAGFKNAIIGLEAPKDSTWSIEDARHSAIVYKPSDIPNASGPHVHDPRSGEIIETHINWYHNIMLLLRNWYMIQCGSVDPRAQKLQFDDELMGELIRFVASHEVGHTLGLRHNFGSSATVPVEKLRDKAWVEANGHTPSIMDYARFNYIAQPEDNIGMRGLFPRIGIYDEWSIEWGYRYLPEYATPEDEIPYSNKTIMAKLNEDKRYTFGTETDSDDPRNQSEDLGDNAMLAGSYGIKNLQRIVPQIIKWTYEPDKGYDNTKGVYNEVVGQFNRYMGHVVKNIAGIYRTPITVEQDGNSEEFVPASIQKEAMQFLHTQLFTTPTWLIDRTLMDKAAVDPISSIGSAQGRVIERLINIYTINKMIRDEAYNGTKAYTAINMFTDLKKSIWGNLASGRTIDIYQRNMQKNYVTALTNIVNAKKNNPAMGATDATGIAYFQLTDLRQNIRTALASSSGIKRSHLQDMLAQIDTTLDTNK